MNSTKEFFKDRRLKIIELLVADELTQEEIGYQLGVTTSTVVRIARQERLRRKDKQYVKDMIQDPPPEVKQRIIKELNKARAATEQDGELFFAEDIAGKAGLELSYRFTGFVHQIAAEIWPDWKEFEAKASNLLHKALSENGF